MPRYKPKAPLWVAWLGTLFLSAAGLARPPELESALAGAIGSASGAPLPIEVETRWVSANEKTGLDTLLVLTFIPLDQLRWTPGLNEHEADLELKIFAASPDGEEPTPRELPCPARVTHRELQDVLGHRLTCGARLEVPPGTLEVGVVVHDRRSGRAGSARSEATGAPDPLPGRAP